MYITLIYWIFRLMIFLLGLDRVFRVHQEQKFLTLEQIEHVLPTEYHKVHALLSDTCTFLGVSVIFR